MLHVNSKASKTKSNSHKKSRKTLHENEPKDNSKLPSKCDVAIQTMENKVGFSERTHDSSICKSLENIMNLKNVSQEKISMSKTDISIVYRMYKNLLQHLKTSDDVHTENYRVLLNDIQKFQSQLNEQDMYQKSIVKLVTSMMARHRIDGKLRRKRSDKVNKMVILKISQIASVNYKLHTFMENLETKNLALESRIEEFLKATNTLRFQKEKLKSNKANFCCCM